MRKLLTFLIALGAVVALSVATPCQAQLSLMGAGATGVGPAPWTPTLLPNLVAWYKADNDGTNVFSDSACTTPQTTNNGFILCWKDKSGHGYHVVNTSGGNRPTYVLAGLNGKPTLTFAAGSNEWLRSAAGVAMGTGTVGSIYLIGTMTTSTQSSARVVAYAPPAGSDGATGSMSLIRTSTTNAFSSIRGGVGVGGTALSLSTETRFGAIFDGTNANPYVNDVAQTTGAVTNASVSGGCISVGGPINSPCALGGSNFWDGNVSEIIMTNNAISAPNLALLDAYLAARW